MTRFYHNSRLVRRSLSVLYHKILFLLPAIILLILLSLVSCEEKPTIIGSDLLPSSDFVRIQSTDTIGVSAYTQYIKRVITNNQTYSYLGKTFDPYFGETKSDFVMQVTLDKKWPGGGPFAIDSAVLYFTIQGAKGVIDTNTIRKISLFQIDEKLNSSVKYYSDRDPDILKKIGTYNLPVIRKDSLQSMRVPLDPLFWVDVMDTTKLEQEGDANDFRSFFKGIYFTMEDSPSPLLVAIGFSTTDFLIRVYYHSFKSGNNLTYDFLMSAKGVRYNRYDHKFALATAPAKVDTTRFGKIDSLIYLQAFNGVYPRIKIPALASIKNTISRISVNKARLTFSAFIDDKNFTSTNLPPLILMKYTVTDTTQYIVPDYYVSTDFYGGKFDTSNLTYSFNLASFVQRYLEGKIPDPVVEMYFPSGEYKNVILKANNSKKPVKFEFTYTRY